MKYKYGASFNCSGYRDNTGESFTLQSWSIGGGEEGYTSLDYLSNDLEKLKERILEKDKYVILDEEHDLFGQSCELGDEIVAVMCDIDDHYNIVAIIFTEPSGPIIVE